MILFTATGAIATAFSKKYPCKIVSARFLDDVQLSELIAESDVIIHNAAAINAQNLPEFIDSNFILTKRILDLAFHVKPKIKFINISSMSILENDKTYKNPQLMTDYAFSKYLSEQYCLKCPLKNSTNVRFSTIFYGDVQKDGLSKLAFDAFKNKKITLYNNGEALRDFIPIEIAADYLFKIANAETFHKTLNIASGQPLSFSYFADLILKRDPSVKIENIEVKTLSVLSEFSLDNVQSIGQLEFNVEYYFKTYLGILNESFDL